MDMKELKCVAIALNKGDLLFYDQPLTISVEKLIPENKPAKNCENVKVHEKCVTYHFGADSEKDLDNLSKSKHK